jgi:RHS repeat-associated protein
VYAELDGTNQLIARYLHGDEFDQTFARVDLRAANASERVQWYLTDHLNSVRLVLDESGGVLDQIAYDAFGNIVAQLNPLLVNPILFASRDFDAETGLYYNRARYLDPTTGRWTTQDPLGFAAGDANLYRYVGNRPTLATDPSGNIAIVPILPIAAAVPENFSYRIAIENLVGGGLTGFGAGLWWAVTFENRPDPAGNARLGYKPAHGRWQRSFHFDAPHGGVSYPHFNAEFGPLRRFNHSRIPSWLYRLGSTSVLRTVARGTVVAGVALDTYTIVSAPPEQRGQAIGGAAGGWGGAAAGAAIGSIICPGVGTVIGGLIGGFGGGVVGSWIGSWF